MNYTFRAFISRLDLNSLDCLFLKALLLKPMAHSAIPPYFSWVVDRLLAVSAFPYHHTHLKYLSDHGITTVISINDEMGPPFHTRPQLKVINLPVSSNSGPSLFDCQSFVSLMENAKMRREVSFIRCV